jgi:hypothetical protein
MKRTRCALVIVAFLAFGAPADEIAGTWKMVVVDPGKGLPTVGYEPLFEFSVDGNQLTGVVKMTQWPGSAPISDGKVDGSRITFTLVHKMPYFTRGGTFYPKFRCEGEVHVRQMSLTMYHAPFDGSEVESDKWVLKGTKYLE